MIDVIVCVKDADQYFPLCLKCIERQKDLGKIIVVTPPNDSESQFIADLYDVTLVEEPKTSCLSWARKQGIMESSNEYVCFVDADVLLGKDHLTQLREESEAGLIGETPHVAIEGILTNKYTKNTLTNVPVKYLPEILGSRQRGFLHNTLFKRESVIHWFPVYTFAWEDWLLTRYIQSQGGIWIRFQQNATSYHLSDGNKFKAAKWSGAGERVVRGWQWNKGNAKDIVLKKDGRYYCAKVVSLVGQVIGNLQASKHLEKN